MAKKMTSEKQPMESKKQRKKSKDQLLFEDGFRAGLEGAHEIEAGEAPINEDGVDLDRMMAMAWAGQKAKMIEAKKEDESSLDHAREKWVNAGRPTEGVVFGDFRYFFMPDGSYDCTKSFNANFGSALLPESER